MLWEKAEIKLEVYDCKDRTRNVSYGSVRSVRVQTNKKNQIPVQTDECVVNSPSASSELYNMDKD